MCVYRAKGMQKHILVRDNDDGQHNELSLRKFGVMLFQNLKMFKEPGLESYLQPVEFVFCNKVSPLTI